MEVTPRDRRSPTLHDFPYRGENRRCYHKWIINVTPPGERHCLHACLYCYARDAIYARKEDRGMVIYSNLAALVEKELSALELCPPVSISNVTDPCQDVPELRAAVKDLIAVLVEWGVSFHIITKGDPAFLSEVRGFPGTGRFFLEVTIEGPREVLELLSPGAPSYERRLESLSWAASLDLPSIVRLDPVIPPLWRSLYGNEWKKKAYRVLCDCATAGAGHVVSSTGRFTAATLSKLREMAGRSSREESDLLNNSYFYDRAYTSSGYMLHKDMRLSFHRDMRDAATALGMTYAVCQELRAGEADTPGLPHCEAYPMPFSHRVGPREFAPIPDCDANCHVSCRGRLYPPCGNPELAVPQPFKPSALKLGAKRG